MNAITFDTLKYVKDLVASGMPEAQARALAKAQTEVFEMQAEGLATKADIASIRAEIREIDVRLKGDLLLVKWMLALVVIVTVVPTLKTFFG